MRQTKILKATVFANLTMFWLAGAVAAAPITSLFNTGVDAAGVPLANGAAELHYAMTSSPEPVTALRVATSANGYPIPPWLADDTISAWTGPVGSVLSGPGGNMTYETTFSLAGYVASTALISGLWSADNTRTAILLNGTTVDHGDNSTGDFLDFRPFSISSGFVSGLNTLDFVVFNVPNGGTNPTGLRVEATGTAELASPIPEPASLALLGAGLLGAGLIRRKNG